MLGASRAALMASGGGGDPYFANVSLLLHMDGANLSTTFTDSSPNAFTMTTAGGAKISTAQSKFGGASGLFASGGDKITHATDADFDFGTGDFSIEWFQRWTSISGNQTVYDYGYAFEANGLLIQTGAGTGAYRVFINAATVLTEGSGASTETWYYYCLTRSGTTVTLRRDGTITGSGTSSGNISGGTLSIGDGYDYAGYPVVGHLDEMRVTKGVVRDGSAVRTAPFPDS
jgi:hypothetical protein